jgi:hypothetical protein
MDCHCHCHCHPLLVIRVPGHGLVCISYLRGGVLAANRSASQPVASRQPVSPVQCHVLQYVFYRAFPYLPIGIFSPCPQGLVVCDSVCWDAVPQVICCARQHRLAGNITSLGFASFLDHQRHSSLTSLPLPLSQFPFPVRPVSCFQQLGQRRKGPLCVLRSRPFALLPPYRLRGT